MSRKFKTNVSDRHLNLCGWFYDKNPSYFKDAPKFKFCEELQLQKFLFFYEMLSVMDEDKDADLTYLRGYTHGPVFSEVFGALKNDTSFLYKIKTIYKENSENIDEDRAKISYFFTQIMPTKELSAFTHNFNIWSSKKDRIKVKEKNVPLNIEDFNKEDKDILQSLKNAYSIDFINSVEIITEGKKCFLVYKEDMPYLTNEHRKVLKKLSRNKELENPVYVGLENGVLLID